MSTNDNSTALVDENGRWIPIKGESGKVVDHYHDFRLFQPEIDYVARLGRLREAFPAGTVFLTATDFRNRAEELIGQIRGNEQLANLLRGVYLPTMVPRLTVADYATILDGTFLSAVERSHCAQYPDRTFKNYRKGDLVGQVTIVPGTKHEQLIARMMGGPVVYLYFPTALQGFGIQADREQGTAFPDGMLLSGGFDTAAAMAMYPDVLARDWNSPGLDMAALQWQEPAYSLCFRACDGNLDFDRRSLDAFGSYSGGLSFVGSVSG